MSQADLVRTSRDGDQFHYLRAARLALELLRPATDLVAVTIEGVSPAEEVAAGLNVIDLALYRGSTNPARATAIAYRQYKHSTVQADQEWTASGLVKSLKGFAERYATLVESYGAADVAARFSFGFETNRPIQTEVADAITDLASGTISKRSTYLRNQLPLEGDALSAFAQLIELVPNAPDYLTQRALLADDMRTYLPDNDRDAPLQLKELVTRKATSQFADNPSITRLDVLETIGTRQEDLFPAPLLIDMPETVVAREQLPTLVADVVAATTPIILQADGGVGKSITAMTLSDCLPSGSVGLVYDCFGNGGYRTASEYRHRPRDGLVQLANELAAQGLCDPLVPTMRADDTAFVRAFMARITQASAQIAAQGSGVLLIVLDAADNAQMVADEVGDRTSFPRLLLREKWPANVRLVLTARPYRIAMLAPPAEVQLLMLEPFSLAETAAFLRARFPEASNADIAEFYRLTSHNPRVQSGAVAAADTVSGVLAALGPTPRTVEDTIGALLDRAVVKARETAHLDAAQVDRVCTALATLRPFVPLDIVAATAKVDVALVRSIAHDLQRPLIVREDAIQFRDEPTETWFREKFRPDGDDLRAFVERLQPLAATSAYVAGMLPQLLLEAGQFDALVALALSSDGLPQDKEIARRDVELQRLQFALKAALRRKRCKDALQLAMKAGGEAAADERQQSLLSANTDLAALFLEPNQLVEQVSRRLIRGGGWTGSDHVYEAALLSGAPSLAGDARSRLRVAYEWLDHYFERRRTKANSAINGRNDQSLDDADLAELFFAELNLHGAAQCAYRLRGWRPRSISCRIGSILARRLIDLGRFDDVDALAIAAGNDVGLVLAVTQELAAVTRLPPRAAVERCIRLLRDRRVRIEVSGNIEGEENRIATITAIVDAAARLRVFPRRQLARLLDTYLAYPLSMLSGRYAYDKRRRETWLAAFALRARLRGRSVRPIEVADAQTRKALRKRGTHYDQDVARFTQDLKTLLPWHELRVDIGLGRVPTGQLKTAIDAAIAASRKGVRHPGDRQEETASEILRLWTECLIIAGGNQSAWSRLSTWRKTFDKGFFIPDFTDTARRVAAAGKTALALDLAADAGRLARQDRDGAEARADALVTIARSVIVASEAEARAWFDEAIMVAGRIGAENLHRWGAIIGLGIAATSAESDEPETAYLFARAAELTYDHVERAKHFPWEDTMAVLTRLSPRSGPTILARWVDRHFGGDARFLEPMIDALRADGHLDARTALALVPIAAGWDLADLLEPALVIASPSEQSQIVIHFMRYARFMGGGVDTWRRIKTLLDRFGLDDPDVDHLLADAETTRSRRASDDASGPPTEARKVPNRDPIFHGIDLTSSADIATAIARYRKSERYYVAEDFFREATARVPAGKESAFLAALVPGEMIGLYELRHLANNLPDAWAARAAVKPAFASLVRAIYRAESNNVSPSYYVQTDTHERAAIVAGLTVADLFAEAVDAIGQTTTPSGAADLFQLARLLAALLDPAAAHQALRYALDLFEPQLEPTDSDGPWRPALVPPATVEAAVAGYLHASLAAPETERRWSAAHAVRLLASLGRTEILDELAARAVEGGGGPFADQALRFYPLHADLWLAIALARVALETPRAILPFEPWLRGQAAATNHHVLIRDFAARALVAASGAGVVMLVPAERQRLVAINQSPFPVIDSKYYDRMRSEHPVERKWEDQRFVFDLDFPKNYLHPLGRAFALPDGQMEIEAEKVIRDDWGLDDDGRWSRDVRGERRYFDATVRRSRSEGAAADDLSFYLAWHATMTLAGKLLASRPLHEDLSEDDDWYSFRRWLANLALVRDDGLWLADRRDMAPVECVTLPAANEAGWPSTLHDDVIDQQVCPVPGAYAVAGSWEAFTDDRVQHVSVRSALVTPDRASALVRAMCDVSGRHYHRLPLSIDAEEQHADHEHYGYDMTSWFIETGREEGIDEHDPWAGGLSTRLLEPAPHVIAALAFNRDASGRQWHEAGATMISLDMWSVPIRENDERRDYGRRIMASQSTLERLLDFYQKSLVIEVRVERSLVRNRYDRSRNREDNEQTTTHFVLFEAGQRPRISIRDRETRPKARRRTGRGRGRP